MVFFFTWMFAFTALSIILGCNNSLESSGNGYNGLLTKIQTFIQVWENSIGNIGNPTYEYWSKVIKDYGEPAVTQSKN